MFVVFSLDVRLYFLCFSVFSSFVIWLFLYIYFLVQSLLNSLRLRIVRIFLFINVFFSFSPTISVACAFIFKSFFRYASWFDSFPLGLYMHQSFSDEYMRSSHLRFCLELLFLSSYYLFSLTRAFFRYFFYIFSSFFCINASLLQMRMRFCIERGCASYVSIEL